MYSPTRPGRDDKEPAPQLGLFSAPPDQDSPHPREKMRTSKSGGSGLPAWAYAAMKPTEPTPLPAPEVDSAPQRLASERCDRTPAGSGRRIWTVADLVSSVRAHVEQAWPDLWVHGEISNLRTVPSGHVYFTLKDGESQLPAVLFRRQAQLLRFQPEDGLEVLLRGKVSVYEQRGHLQLITEHLEPVGAGSLQIAFEQLKARLDAEGLFSAERKRALPPYPRCVGIVTSPAGAVIRDFLNVAGRRHAALDVLLYPAAVQGGAAAAEVAAGIAYFNQARNVDVIVVARGGGSLEDLAPFNTELLARAIAGSALPVVSAVGHETDFTIADFVADLRAPTPSAAAELITAAQHRVEERVAALGERLGRACRYQLILASQRLGALSMAATQARLDEGFNRREQRVDTLVFRMDSVLRRKLHGAAAAVERHSVEAACARVRGGLGERARRVDQLRYGLQSAQTARLNELRERLQAATSALLRQDARQRLLLLRGRWTAVDARLGNVPSQQLRLLRGRWAAVDARLRSVPSQQMRAPGERHASLARQLASLSPLAVLSRGYALVFDAQGKLVKRAAEVAAGEQLTLRLAEGTVRTRAEERQGEA